MTINQDRRFFSFLRPPRVPFWVLVSFPILGLAAAGAGTFTGYFLNADLPDVRALEDYQPPTITQILDQQGRTVQQFAEQKRIVVPLHRLSQHLQKAVIAVEDSNFYGHMGVDPWAVARAIVRDIKEARWAEGGSTLTQQLAKILFLRPEKTIRRKIQEALLAMHIEKTYTKQEILAFYLNQIYMGHGRYGMEAASRYYFGISAADLSIDQAALLAGLIQRPEGYSPVRHAEHALRRRNKVITRMLAEGLIAPEAASAATAAPVVVARQLADESPAPYFAEEIRKVLSARYGDDALLREGLTVRTSFELELLNAAARALARGLRVLDKRQGFRRPERHVLSDQAVTLESYKHPGWERPLAQGDFVTGLVMKVARDAATIRVGAQTARIGPADAAWTGSKDMSALLKPGDLTSFEVKSAGETLALALDQEPAVEGAVLALSPQTGDILAMAGGYDFNRSQFNRATQAMRQSGSAFKPFIMAAAIDGGFRPSDILMDEPTIFVDQRTGEPYQPENYSRRYSGVVTLRRTLEDSINIPTVTVLNALGYDRTVAYAKNFGFASKLYPYPSLALGTSEVTLMELTAAYGAFPAGGILATPRYYNEIRDRDGNVLEEVKRERREVMRDDVAAVMVSQMQGVVQRGTAASAAPLGTAIAGKTGTTDDYTDAWFIGFTPDLVVGVWVGYDKKITLGTQETGAKAALPIWIETVGSWLKDRPAQEFPLSAGVVTLPVDADTGLRVAPELGCKQVIMETFIKGTEIERPCTPQAHFRVSLPYYLQRYRIVDGAAAIDDAEMDRLLRENPFDLEIFGRSLNVLTAGGRRVLRVAGGEDAGSDVTWGVFRFSSRDDDNPAEDMHFAQLLPDQVPPIDARPYPHVGLDGRSAAVIPINPE